MNIEILASTVSDNFFYLVTDGELAVLIDPIDARTAIEAVERSGCRLAWVVNTHFHPDHVGGNDAVFERFGDAKLCAGPDHVRIDGAHPVDLVLGHGDTLDVGQIHFRILETPGHTAGHISLLVDGHLFSGDTIFVGGAGNCRFGGDPTTLFRTYRDILGALPAETRFYPGHDYARRNLEFALSLEPGRAEPTTMLGRLDDADEPLLVTTLGEEAHYNPFFRADDAALQQALRTTHGDLWAAERSDSDDDAEATFRTTRALRNSW